jgi:1-acyl-sn-glycerol-3-phosphate acyltransferase
MRFFLHLAAAMVILRFIYPRAGVSRRREITAWWSRRMLDILAIRLHCEGDIPRVDGTGALIAANHVSWVDIFAISAARPTRFVAKSEIRDWPIAGWIVERAGTIFVHRARRHDTGRINALVHEAIGNGDCIGLFPEGTTTEGDRLLRFHSSLFEPAVANGARVFPVALRYEHPDGSHLRAAAYVGELSFVQSLALVIRTPSTRARVSFAPPIDTKGLTRREVAAQAESRVATLLGFAGPRSGPGTPAGPPAAPR